MNEDVLLTQDPDSHSRTLHLFHQQLWSKTLPNGQYLVLETNLKKPFKFYVQNNLKRYQFSSDSISNSYLTSKKMSAYATSVSKDLILNYENMKTTIGSYIIFPSERISNHPTINAIRGIHPMIRDRFDLTLECIRRYYNDKGSPLSQYLKLYDWFFKWFVNFEGYVKFFHLEAYVNKEGLVDFLIPFNEFKKEDALPKSLEMYEMFINNLTNKIIERNKMIKMHQ